MNKKLNNILSTIKNNRYNNFDSIQKNAPITLTKYLMGSKFTGLFNDLLKICKGSRTHTDDSTKKEKRITKTDKVPHQPIVIYPINSTVPSIVPSIAPSIVPSTIRYKFTPNLLFNKIIKDLDFYIIKVKKKRYDVYSEVFMKAIDKLYCILPEKESINYLKKIKYKVIEQFNKKNLYKLFNYSAKDFKKSDLDDIFASNKPIKLSMLKVYANVFNCNLIYLNNKDILFMTRFVDNLTTVILTEDTDCIYCLRNKNKNSFIRGARLKEVLGINRSLLEKNISSMGLPALQNLSRMKNIDYKKDGKTRKINKTKQELISGLIIKS